MNRDEVLGIKSGSGIPPGRRQQIAAAAMDRLLQRTQDGLGGREVRTLSGVLINQLALSLDHEPVLGLWQTDALAQQHLLIEQAGDRLNEAEEGGNWFLVLSTLDLGFSVIQQPSDDAIYHSFVDHWVSALAQRELDSQPLDSPLRGESANVQYLWLFERESVDTDLRALETLSRIGREGTDQDFEQVLRGYIGPRRLDGFGLGR